MQVKLNFCKDSGEKMVRTVSAMVANAVVCGATNVVGAEMRGEDSLAAFKAGAIGGAVTGFLGGGVLASYGSFFFKAASNLSGAAKTVIGAAAYVADAAVSALAGNFFTPESAVGSSSLLVSALTGSWIPPAAAVVYFAGKSLLECYSARGDHAVPEAVPLDDAATRPGGGYGATDSTYVDVSPTATSSVSTR